MPEFVMGPDYIPKEHAADPMIDSGDPTPPGKVAIWLFLASEIMFFMALLAAYIIFRASQPELFKKFSLVLNRPLALVNTVVLIFSSLTMALAVSASRKNNRPRTILYLLITFLCGCTFLVIKSIEYAEKWNHHTIVYRVPGDSLDKTKNTQHFFVVDGHFVADKSDSKTLVLHGARMEIPAQGQFDIHLIGEEDVLHEIPDGNIPIPRASIVQDINYMPWKNIFFACYFTLTGIHGIHLLGGVVALMLLLVQAIRGKLYPFHTEYIGIYWYFVDLIWLFLFPLLYLI